MALLGRPIQLITPFFAAGKIASKVMLDLTVYLRGPSERELEYLIDLYNRMCPVDRLVDYKIAELEYWSPLAQPALTASGRSAAAGAFGDLTLNQSVNEFATAELSRFDVGIGEKLTIRMEAGVSLASASIFVRWVSAHSFEYCSHSDLTLRYFETLRVQSLITSSFFRGMVG